jgi:hypothetical protein
MGVSRARVAWPQNWGGRGHVSAVGSTSQVGTTSRPVRSSRWCAEAQRSKHRGRGGVMEPGRRGRPQRVITFSFGLLVFCSFSEEGPWWGGRRGAAAHCTAKSRQTPCKGSVRDACRGQAYGCGQTRLRRPAEMGRDGTRPSRATGGGRRRATSSRALTRSIPSLAIVWRVVWLWGARWHKVACGREKERTFSRTARRACLLRTIHPRIWASALCLGAV